MIKNSNGIVINNDSNELARYKQQKESSLRNRKIDAEIENLKNEILNLKKEIEKLKGNL